jgi:hypothetical protein
MVHAVLNLPVNKIPEQESHSMLDKIIFLSLQLVYVAP